MTRRFAFRGCAGVLSWLVLAAAACGSGGGGTGNDGGGSAVDAAPGSSDAARPEEPVALSGADGTTGPIALDDTHVYWVDDDRIYRIGKQGGVRTFVAYGLAVELIVRDGYVYWISGGVPGGVYRVPVGGGTTETLWEGDGDPRDMALDAQYVYWADSYQRNVNRVPLAGGMVTAVVTLQTALNAVEVDGANLYWYAGSTLYKNRLGGGSTPTALATGETEAELALDADFVYWTGRGSFETRLVRKVPNAGGAVVELATNRPNAARVFLHGGFVYWARSTIERVPVAGGPVETLGFATNTADFAVDDEYVFWTTTGGGVLRLRLP
jgi:hypothetical protein